MLLQARPERQEFLKKITDLMFTMIEKHCPVDSACDQMGKQFLHDSLPPALTEGEIFSQMLRSAYLKLCEIW